MLLLDAPAGRIGTVKIHRTLTRTRRELVRWGDGAPSLGLVYC